EWRAVVARLDGFEMSVNSAQGLGKQQETIAVEGAGGRPEIGLSHLLVKLPNGRPLVSSDAFAIRPSERVLVTGPSGAGKSTLFRAIAGIWPFGSGTVTIPEKAKLMMLPQRPYFPIGPLGDAVIYPAAHGTFTPDQIGETLVAVGLPQLA